MNSKLRHLKTLACLTLLSLISAKAENNYNFQAMMQPVPSTAILASKEFDIWGGAPIRDKEGKYHLFYSRWPSDLGHLAWVTHCEIAQAVSDSPFGPWTHKRVILPNRGPQFWDGSCTHNPTILEVDGKYYLYYMGNTGSREFTAPLNWEHRNNQRIGVAVADSLDGPWKRFEGPVLGISSDPEAPDALCVSNPSVTTTPNGGVLMMYKTVAKKLPLPSGGPVGVGIAVADNPLGPFTKLDVRPFHVEGERFSVEDFFVWREDTRYWAIVKDRHGHFTGHKGGFSLGLFESEDGIDWKPAENILAAIPGFTWESGREAGITIMERPQLLFEDGKPIALVCAAARERNKAEGFNVQIPLKP